MSEIARSMLTDRQKFLLWEAVKQDRDFILSRKPSIMKLMKKYKPIVGDISTANIKQALMTADLYNEYQEVRRPKKNEEKKPATGIAAHHLRLTAAQEKIDRLQSRVESCEGVVFRCMNEIVDLKSKLNVKDALLNSVVEALNSLSVAIGSDLKVVQENTNVNS